MHACVRRLCSPVWRPVHCNPCSPSPPLPYANARTPMQVVHILRSVAHLHGRTVVCSIHQPSSEVFHLFDDLVVLAAGQVRLAAGGGAGSGRVGRDRLWGVWRAMVRGHNNARVPNNVRTAPCGCAP